MLCGEITKTNAARTALGGGLWKDLRVKNLLQNYDMKFLHCQKMWIVLVNRMLQRDKPNFIISRHPRPL